MAEDEELNHDEARDEDPKAEKLENQGVGVDGGSDNDDGASDSDDSDGSSSVSGASWSSEIEEGSATWYYLEDAAQKIFEYVDRVAQEYVFGVKGMGLNNMAIRKAWNRSVKLKEAIEQRDVEKVAEHLKIIKLQLEDDQFTQNDVNLKNDLESILKGVKYISRETKAFKVFLAEVPDHVRTAICKPETEDVNADTEMKKGDSTAQNAGKRSVSGKQGSIASNQPSSAVSTFVARAALDFQILHRIVLRKLNKYGCFLPKHKEQNFGMGSNRGEQFEGYQFDPVADDARLEREVKLEEEASRKKVHFPKPLSKLQFEEEFSEYRACRMKKIVEQSGQTREGSDRSQSYRTSFMDLSLDHQPSKSDDHFNHGLVHEVLDDWHGAKLSFEQVKSGPSLVCDAQFRIGKLDLACALSEPFKDDNNLIESPGVYAEKAAAQFEAAVQSCPETQDNAPAEELVQQRNLGCLLGMANVHYATKNPHLCLGVVKEAKTLLHKVKAGPDHHLISKELELLERLCTAGLDRSREEG